MGQMGGSLLSDFPRGDPDRAPPDADPHGFKPPSSTFTKPALLRSSRLAWQPGKLFLGIADGEAKRDDQGRTFIVGGHAIGVDDDRHVCTFAGSRSGKGRAVIIPNMLHYPGSVLATDPKGELATITARQRVALGQSVHVLDPFGVAVGYPHQAKLLKGFNPLASMRDGNLVEDAGLIADALVVASDKDPHWDESARAFIEGLLLHIRTSPEYEGRRSLLTLREVIGRAGGASGDVLQTKMERNDAAGGVIQSAAADFFQRPDNERGSVLSSTRRHLKFIDMFRETPIGRLTLEQDDFQLLDLKTKPTTIYLCLPARHIGTCNRWLRLFVNLMLQGMEMTKVSLQTMPGKVPVLCVLDEFAVLGHMKQIEDAAGQIAGFGVKLWVILQDLGQLQALYEDRWETFLGNSGILQFFGNNDLTTLKWISERLGQCMVEGQSRLAAHIHTAADGAGVDSRAALYDLLTPDEVARFFGRDDPRLRQLVIWAGRKSPFLVLQRAYYDKHGLFRNQQGPLFDE